MNPEFNFKNKAFEQSEYAINITDTTGTIVDVNESYLQLYGFASKSEVLGKKQNIIRSNRTPIIIYKNLWNTIQSGKTWKGELYNRTIQGVEVPVYLTIHPLKEGEDTVGYMGFTMDRSQQVDLENQLLHTNRLAVLGTIGAGLAHELNNPLTSISLEAEFLEDELAAAGMDEAVASVKNISMGADRMQRVIKHLLEYIRKNDEQKDELISLSHLHKDAMLFLDRQFQRREIVFENHIEEGLFVRGVRADVESILHNLLTNSRDAFDVRGLDDGQEKKIAIEFRKLSDLWLEFTYFDNAGGIPPKVRRRIFEPFFTTKGEGKGTGLGLSISKNIVHDMGGTIDCESRDGWTKFTILLPLAEPQPTKLFEDEDEEELIG